MEQDMGSPDGQHGEHAELPAEYQPSRSHSERAHMLSTEGLHGEGGASRAEGEADPRAESENLLQLKFRDVESALVDINAQDLSEVLQGLMTLTGDFAKAGLFGEGPPPELRVRPPRAGSFILETALHWTIDNPEGAAALMGGSGALTAGLANGIKTATKMLRVDVANFERLDNGQVKIIWQDNTVNEVPPEVWDELNKRKRRRKKALRQIMAPIGDEADTLEVRTSASGSDPDEETPAMVADREDYLRAAQADIDDDSGHTFFEDEAQVQTADFVGNKWKVKTSNHGTRKAIVEDLEFLQRVDNGLAIRKSDIFHLKIREDWTRVNGKSTRNWTVLKVDGHRRGSADGDGS